VRELQRIHAWPLMLTLAVLLPAVFIALGQSVRYAGIVRSEVAQRRSPIEHDRQFHLALAEISGNSVMARLVGELFDERHSPISSKLRSRYENTRTWNLALKEHEAVLHALEARDPLAAQTAMRAHLKASEQRWVGD